MQNMTDEQKQRMVALIHEEQQIEDALTTWRRNLGGCLDDNYAAIVAENATDMHMTPAQMADAIQSLIDRYRVVHEELVPLMQAIGQRPIPTAQLDDDVFGVPLHMIKRLRQLAHEA